MKSFVKIVSVFLLAFVLIGNSGLSLYQSACNYTGVKSIHILSHNDPCHTHTVKDTHACCKTTKSISTATNKCCDERQIDARIYLPFASQKHALEIPSFQFVLPISMVYFAKQTLSFQEPKNTVFNLKPPLPGSLLLQLIDCLRI